MKKIPFNIKYRPQIESGEYKVVTREGRPARIICWNRKVEGANVGKNIIALITIGEDGTEDTCAFYQDGHFWCKSNDESDSKYDLFIITNEPELTEFKENLRQVIVESLSGETPNGYGGTMKWTVYLSDDDVRKLAPKILELAKKELCLQCSVGIKEYWRGKEDARKEQESMSTFHYPTYGPPCFGGGPCTNPFRDCINCPNRFSTGQTCTTTSGTCKKED